MKRELVAVALMFSIAVGLQACGPRSTARTAVVELSADRDESCSECPALSVVDIYGEPRTIRVPMSPDATLEARRIVDASWWVQDSAEVASGKEWGLLLVLDVVGDGELSRVADAARSSSVAVLVSIDGRPLSIVEPGDVDGFLSLRFSAEPAMREVLASLDLKARRLKHAAPDERGRAALSKSDELIRRADEILERSKDLTTPLEPTD